MNTARVLTIQDIPSDQPMPLITRRRIVGHEMMISDVVLAPGFSVPSHQHVNEQFAVVLSGRCRFGIGKEGAPEHHTVEVSRGQVLHLPPNVPHSCLALEETHILDLFSPPSEKTGVDRG